MPSLVPIVVNAVPTDVARLLTLTTAAKEISEATSTYSIRSCPRSSSKASASVRIFLKRLLIQMGHTRRMRMVMHPEGHGANAGPIPVISVTYRTGRDWRTSGC